MDIGHIYKGMLVKIDEVSPRTYYRHTISSTMKKYLGTVQKVQVVEGSSVYINEDAWSPEDLTPGDEIDHCIDESQRPKNVKSFDTKELDL